MNKQQFIDNLGRHFSSLPEQDQLAILRDYEAYYQQRQQDGLTEEDISRELGHPLTVAKDALFAAPPATSWTEPPMPPLPPFPAAPPVYRTAGGKPDIARLVGVTIALFFLNVILAVPLIASVWSVFVSLCAAALSVMLSPVALAVETAWYGDYDSHKLMLALGMVGVGMLLAGLALPVGKLLYKATKGYIRWNYRTWRGKS
ncbi:HAAS domain-containing protein [Cohnella suwonensis]|uniref:HAAS domain-containing protein n=1 Tax=Cohnella suwonensis TaxID=696072 RepID=A0ABW0LX20_9BACL